MSRFTGPRLKKMRGLGLDLPGLSRKSTAKRPYPPGQHGQTRRRGKDSEYKKQLVEKQKLRFNYGVHERHMRKLMKEARRSGDTGTKLLEMLESRLDNVVFRAGFAATIPGARQLVNHGHVTIDGRKMDRASYRVKIGEKISVSPKAKSFPPVEESWKHPAHERPAWLVCDTGAMVASMESAPAKDSLLFPIDENLVLEFYAKRM
ncbi:30S ribosomal protein S4 [bacterium]|nr:MAG: 30S ribosomal protein S4 [bacterium]RKZ17820.1 MAG: 30S ribosomal protein S4 [bacterium]